MSYTKVIIHGSSHLGPHRGLRDNVVTELEKNKKVTTKVITQGGRRLHHLTDHQQLETEVKHDPNALFFIMLGDNDLRAQPYATQGLFASMQVALKASTHLLSGLLILCAIMPNPSNKQYQKQATDLNRLIKEIAVEFPKARIADLGILAHTVTGHSRFQSLLSWDGVHFSHYGNGIMNLVITAIIKTGLSIINHEPLTEAEERRIFGTLPQIPDSDRPLFKIKTPASAFPNSSDKGAVCEQLNQVKVSCELGSCKNCGRLTCKNVIGLNKPSNRVQNAGWVRPCLNRSLSDPHENRVNSIIIPCEGTLSRLTTGTHIGDWVHTSLTSNVHLSSTQFQDTLYQVRNRGNTEFPELKFISGKRNF